MAGIQSDVPLHWCVDNTIEIWAGTADQPFMNPGRVQRGSFEELLGDENICCDENKL